MQPLKPTEIRIGNICNYTNYKYETTQITIEAPDIVAISVGNKDYLPIELTEECLSGFGFERKKVNKEENIIYGNYDFIKFNLEKIGNNYHHEYCDYRILYVHQLQNLYFALTGEELK